MTLMQRGLLLQDRARGLPARANRNGRFGLLPQPAVNLIKRSLLTLGETRIPGEVQKDLFMVSVAAQECV